MEAVPSTEPRVGRLLLVDDEENILKSLKRLLRHERYEIELAPSGNAALPLLTTFSPQVVVSDFRMPGMNGVEFLTQVKTVIPKAQRIMLTGQADQLALEDAINRSEIFRFIAKPWNDAQFVLTVKNAFNQFQIEAENERLFALTQEQNDQLRSLNADLETRVTLRTRQLATAKREWEASFDCIDLPLALVREDFVLRRANLACGRVARKPIQEVGTLPKCHSFLFGRDTPCDGCPMRAAVRSGQVQRGEVNHADKTFVVTAYPMDEGQQAVCAYRDVTDERAMHKRIVETEKMAAVGQLAGGVAHEINNPLGAILAFAQLMRRESGRPDTDHENLALIEASALRCKRIVESLLKFSRRSRLEDRRPFELNKCVEDAILLFRAQIKSAPQMKLTVQFGSGLPTLYGDPVQLGQVVLNLLQNALQATPGQEGTILVDTARTEAGCMLRVRDTGKGIHQDHLPHIFEPHFTTKAPGEGTGLGLAIAYRIVEDHGGHFTVESEVGQGATFVVHLPANAPLKGE